MRDLEKFYCGPVNFELSKVTSSLNPENYMLYIDLIKRMIWLYIFYYWFTFNNNILYFFQQFLQRLHHTRPTRGLSRTEQLKDYKHTLLHGVPIAAIHRSPVPDNTYVTGNATLGSTIGSTGRRSRPSSAKSNASTIRSRPGSAKSIASSIVSRPCSAKSTARSADNRPAWNDRFSYS